MTINCKSAGDSGKVSEEGASVSLRPHTLHDEDDQLDSTREKQLKRLFLGVILIEIALNYDVGAVPAVLESIQGEFAMDPWMQGERCKSWWRNLTLTDHLVIYRPSWWPAVHRPDRDLALCWPLAAEEGRQVCPQYIHAAQCRMLQYIRS
jgi:hypothetical protein